MLTNVCCSIGGTAEDDRIIRGRCFAAQSHGVQPSAPSDLAFGSGADRKLTSVKMTTSYQKSESALPRGRSLHLLCIDGVWTKAECAVSELVDNLVRPG